jgi:hypothetical protein
MPLAEEIKALFKEEEAHPTRGGLGTLTFTLSIF